MASLKTVSFRDRKNEEQSSGFLSKKKRMLRPGWKRFRMFIIVILITAINTVGAFAYTEMAAACPQGETCRTSFLPFSTLQNTFQSELKQNNGITNVLIAGIDTRGENSGLMNTDTLIILSIDRQNESINMVSIPRDLYVSYEIDGVGFFTSKINGVYANGEISNGGGMDAIESVVENIVGLPIHYNVLVTLEGFEKAIDAIDGIEVDVPVGFTGKYPEGAGYIHITFEDGLQTMNGEEALQYARIRQTIDVGSESSDFARARRQQLVINAVKEKILSSETLTNPAKLWELYSILEDSVVPSELSLADIKAALDMREFADIATVTNVVLDPNFGGLNNYIYVPPRGEEDLYIIQAWDTTYTDIQNRLAAIRQYPLVFNEEPTMVIYDATQNYVLQNDYLEVISIYNPLFTILGDKIPITHENSGSSVVIYDFTNGEKPGSLEYLKATFGIETVVSNVTQAPPRTFNEDFALVIYQENEIWEAGTFGDLEPAGSME